MEVTHVSWLTISIPRLRARPPAGSALPHPQKLLSTASPALEHHPVRLQYDDRRRQAHHKEFDKEEFLLDDVEKSLFADIRRASGVREEWRS
jgi:hypothetical protein